MSINDLLRDKIPGRIQLSPEARVFVTERHLATLSSLRADGSPHVVPVAFTWLEERGIARITTNRASVKVKNALSTRVPPRAALCQVDGGRWLTLEGTLHVVTDPVEIDLAVVAYAQRYRQLSPNPERVVLEVKVDRVLGSQYMVDTSRR